MNRRKALKGLTIISTLSILPVNLLAFKPKSESLHFIGLGTGGSHVLEYFYKQLIGTNAKFTNISDTPSKRYTEINFIRFTEEDNCFQTVSSKLKQLFSKEDKYILLAGLGASTGTCLTERLSVFLNKNNKKFMTICSVPFNFEGKKRIIKAKELVNKLNTNTFFNYFYLENINNSYDNLTVKEAFKKADEKFYEILQNLI